MDESLERTISLLLEHARDKGRDHLTQTTLAVRAICQAHPELTAAEAAGLVRSVRRRSSEEAVSTKLGGR